MRWTQTFIPTLKETPQDAEITSHRLMQRAGLIRQLAAGAYSYLPLGFRVLQKIENIIREEMNSQGAVEILLPAIHPAEIWKKTGRYETLGEDMFSFKDRHGKLTVLGPTHEEIITDLVAKEVNSYRQLPVTLYQIQTKFRDEARPRSGVLRSREFIMKDAYSFNKDEKCLDATYKKMHKAYINIFKRCGLDVVVIEADPGVMGGTMSHEFMVLSENGEDSVTIKGKTMRAIELGHIFNLGTKYSDSLGAKYLTKDGQEKTIIMGCYGIGVNRIMAAAIEQGNDKDGIIWPGAIAPYQVLVLPLAWDDKRSRQLSEEIYKALTDKGIDVLLDDRDERAGIKFKDADLIGIPIRVVLGEKGLRENKVEISSRKDKKSISVETDASVVAQFIGQKL